MATTATTTLPPASNSSDSPKLIKKAAMPTQTTFSSFGCQHVKNLLHAARQQATDGYTRLIRSLHRPAHLADRTHKTQDGVVVTGQVTYLCLQCPHVSSGKERHRKDHAFAVESTNGFILCHECNDFVYDPTFEEIRSHARSKKRKLSVLQSDDRKLFANNTTVAPCAATGLRGLYNMGQTCFMSVILQSLIHNPLIRTFYLSEGHRQSECEREACTSCALDDIFTTFFSEEKHEGYGAVHMLQGCWKGGGGLAGYSQQDAHEYLGFILNNLHTANTASGGIEDDENDEDDEAKSATKVANGHDSTNEASGKDCPCVVHQTFGGQLKSTVTCTNCNNTTTSFDPFMDLSLDIRQATSVTVKKKKLTLINGTTTVKEILPMDLTECLDRFTSSETLSTDSYHCCTCDSPQPACKRLALSRLPPVVPIHLKRFSHSKTLAQSSKVETHIRFPLTLDLAPYLAPASSSDASSAPADLDDVDEPEDEPGRVTQPVYELSSVVVHRGKIDNGHYISYARQDEEWFRFDDSMVVQADEKEVLAAEAYMLFYVARGF